MRHDPIDPARSPGPERPPDAPADARARPRRPTDSTLARRFEWRLDERERRAHTAIAGEENLAAELEEIRAARARLATGTFGTCERCLTQIPLSRLRAWPTARECAACRARVERQAAAGSSR
ncbi:MAG: hypothetical protein HYR86_16625 [Candidatus Rokubacteria bacterium]|nr:hypothetical protein [Candidatus Rokubacteria bacterium]